MRLWRMTGPSNRRARLFVGALLLVLFCLQCTRTEAFRESRFIVAVAGHRLERNSPSEFKQVEELAKSDHVALLELCLANYEQSYHDYVCTFLKQETINQVVGKEQEVEVKFLEKPYSVAMTWTPETAPIGDRVLYVEDKYNNQMLVRPKGFLGQLVGTVAREPDGPEAMRNTLRPVNMFGFRRALQSLLAVYERAGRQGDLREAFGGFAQVAGRETVVLIRYLPPKDDYPAYKTVIFIDLEHLVPVCVEGYDWDEQLSSRYLYKDVSFNVGLTNADFLPAANEMKPPA